MITVCGVRFKDAGKVYDFTLGSLELSAGDRVVVETARGLEIGTVAIAKKEIEEQEDREVKPIVRIATAEDLKKEQENLAKVPKAMDTCRAKIAAHKLDMKLIDCEYAFDGSKISFYFTSDGRVDFRDLVKDLAATFRTRIELRQIGVRDECKLKGGLGICGQPMCCATNMDEFHTVSIKMAKDQNLSLNPTRISGTCGRLMCCLKYEQAAYEELNKITPHTGALVDTPAGRGMVTDCNLITGALKVKMGKEIDSPIKSFNRSEVTLIHDGKNGKPRADAEEKEEAELKNLE